MSRKIKKRDIDEQLLESFITVEHEWKQIRSIMEKSIEPMGNGLYHEHVARAKYLFLLREARHRKISAIRYNK